MNHNLQKGKNSKFSIFWVFSHIANNPVEILLS